MATIYLSKTPKDQLPKRHAFDHYVTEAKHVRAVLRLIPSNFNPTWILDPGAGTGSFGVVARQRWQNAIIVGIEYRPTSRPKAYDFWLHCTSYLLRESGVNPDDEAYFDLIIGNPPYGKDGDERDNHAPEKFVRRSLELLRPGGLLAFLLPLTWLGGQERAEGLFYEFPPKRVAVAPVRPSFTGNRRTDATEYMAALWQKGWRGKVSALTWDRDLIAEHRREVAASRKAARTARRVPAEQLPLFA